VEWKRVVTLSIIYTTSGGSVNPQTQIDNIQLTFECGPDSTVVTAPLLDTVFSASDSTDFSTSLERTYGFHHSNPACPIETIELDTWSYTNNLANVFTIERLPVGDWNGIPDTSPSA
jgi:hypothetical protein